MLFSFAPAFSQELIFENISSKLSLPSAECYNVMQDSKGYMWVASEQGLIRYNGSSSKVFAAKDNLPEKAIYAVFEDNYKQLWVTTAKNRVLYYSHDKFKEIPLKIPLLTPNGKSKNINYLLSYFNNEIYIHSTRYLYAIDIRTKATRAISKIAANEDLVFLKLGKALLPINSNYLYNRLNKAKNNQTGFHILVKDGTHELRFNVLQKNLNDIHWRVLSCHASGSNFFTINNKLIKVTPELSYEIYEMPASIISLYADKDGGLWVGTIKNGVFYYPKANISSTPMISLSNLSVSGTYQDREGNVWCTTLEDGVYFANSKYIVQYSNKTTFVSPPNLLKKVGDKLFVSTAQSGLMTYGPNDTFYSTSKQLGKQIHHLFFNKGKYVIGQNSTMLTSSTDFKNIKPSNWSYNDNYKADAIYESTSDTTKTIFSITYNKILRHDKNTASFFTLIRSSGKCIQYLDSNTLIYGCANGLYTVNIKSQKHHRIPGIERAVTKILPTHKNGIWITSKGDGLYQYQNGQFKRMDRELNLPTDVFYDIDVDSLGKIWIASNLGIISLKKNNKGYKVQHFQDSNGLPSNEIYKLAIYQNQLFLSTPKGLGRFPINISLINAIPPTFSLAKISTHTTLLSTKQQSVSLSHKDNSLSLDFNILAYKNNKQHLIYRIKQNQPFTTVEGNQIVLQNLKPDKYVLTVYALNNDRMKSLSPYLLNIEIIPPFWQIWWFLSLCLLLLFIIIWFMRKLQIERIKQREREKTRINTLIAQSKLSALQAKMNPHFIFNAINSIQNYILKNQSEAAQSYLTKFSRLIRLVLRQSAEKAITLKEEIDTLTLYIELEKLRFKDIFEYRLVIAPILNTQTIFLPTMLIQPYVENAIWHGLMNLKGERRGELHIDIQTIGDELLISIKDNGIGRERAAAFRKEKNYVSAGMILTEERLNTLQDIFPNGNFKIKITDLEQGTKVDITLSLSYDYTAHDHRTG